MNEQATMSVFDRVAGVVARCLPFEPASISAETHLFDDLGADSLDVVELVMEAEEEFGVEIADEDGEHVQTVGDLVRAVERQGV